MTIELITHEGVFHADEIFATALLKFIYENQGENSIVQKINYESYCKRSDSNQTDEPLAYLTNFINDHDVEVIIHRTNDVNEYVIGFDKKSIFNISKNGNKCIVYDIGRGIFDHHQPDASIRKTGGKYSSFGLLWKMFGVEAIKLFVSNSTPKFRADVWKRVDERFVKAIDAHDNGESINPLSKMIGTFNPGWTEYCTADVRMDKFMECLSIATKILVNEIRSHIESELALSIMNSKIDEAYEANMQYIILDRFTPYNEAILNHPHGENIMFVIHPSAYKNGEWIADSVRKSFATREMRMYHAEELRGQPREILMKHNWTFVHSSGFIGSAVTKEDAIKLVEYSLSK